MPIEKKDIEQVAEVLEVKFNEMKSANDKALEAVKGELASTKEKAEKQAHDLAELQAYKNDLDEQLKKQGRIGGQGDSAKTEHRKAFEGFIRKGQTEGLEELERKALNLGVDADGGYAIPEELESSILELLRDGTPMRSVCNQITVGSDTGYKRLVNLNGAASGWVGETTARPATGSPEMAEISPFMGEIYANPEATQKSLDDIYFNAENWLASSIALEFAEKENAAFTSGDASNKPKGFLDYASAATADSVRAFGTLEHMLSGTQAEIDANDIIKIIYKLKAGYRNGAAFMGGTDTLADLMVLTDTTGQYLWRPGLEIGQSSTLRGYNFVENEDMPAKAAGSQPLAFGNFMRGYTIVDRVGTRSLRDPFTNKPYVGFYTTKRVGGMVADSQAIKLIQCAA
jgi:HK97 family phage major capsid protein